MRPIVRRLAIAATAVLVLSACGSDGGGDDGTNADSAKEAATCSPVGADLAGRATTKLDVVLADFSISPGILEAPAGVITFATRNAGTENHELAFLPGGGEVPMTSAGKPDEKALEKAGAFELEAYGPGQSCNATYELKPGRYTVFCIVTGADGLTHYAKGMRGQLTVR